MAAVAEEDGVRAAGDDRGDERGDAGTVLDRVSGGRKMAHAEAAGAFDAVTEPGHRTAIGTGRLAAATIIVSVLEAAAPPVLIAAFRAGLS